MAGNQDPTAQVPKKGRASADDDMMLPLEMVVAPLVSLAPSVSPDPALFARIAEAVGISDPLPGFYVCRSDEGGWKPLASGIRIRTLSERRPGGRVTILMEMAPGAVLPAHPHETEEECYVIDGELEAGGDVFRAGDFLIASKGSVHPTITSSKGCRVLLSLAPASPV